MDSFDPIPDLLRIGYTPREAGFLTLVGRLSGYFLGPPIQCISAAKARRDRVPARREGHGKATPSGA